MSIPAFAVFGYPVAHSLSPQIHQDFAAQFGITLDYRTIEACPAGFADAVQNFFAAGGRGANITLPYKATACALAAIRSEAVERAGVANVLTVLSDDRLAADNTDGAGFVRDLRERHGNDFRGQRVLLLGAGGAARGVAWPMLATGIAELVIVNRREETGALLAAALEGVVRVSAYPWRALPTLGAFDLIVNATSAGVLQQALVLPRSLVDRHSVCYDLGYGPAATAFLRWAAQAGARHATDGLGMLLEQAADAFELWHERRPRTEPVYQALRRQTDDSELAADEGAADRLSSMV